MSYRALFTLREETWQWLNECRRWIFIVYVQWSRWGRGGSPDKPDYTFICMVSGDIKHKIKTNRCCCSCSILSQEKFLFFILPLSYSIPVNFAFFFYTEAEKGRDKKCPWLRKLLGKRDVLLYYLKLKGEMNVICHFLGKFSNHKDMCNQALPE